MTRNAGMLEVRPLVAEAIRGGHPVVALESTLISHGLPWPLNLETAHSAEAAVRSSGAIPATIAILKGKPTVGLTLMELEDLLTAAQRSKLSPV